MNIITSIGEGLGKLFHGKRAAQVTTAATSELPKAVAAEIQAAGGKIKSGMPATDTLALGTPTQAQESIIEKIEGLKGLRLASLETQAREGASESVTPLGRDLDLPKLPNKLLKDIPKLPNKPFRVFDSFKFDLSKAGKMKKHY